MLIAADFLGISSTISDAINRILIGIDKIVFNFVSLVFQLIMILAKTEIFTQTTIDIFAKRIYVILGLVMVFKMMISFVQILIDPDTINDKDRGVVSVLKRVIISLILIVLVPSIFSTAREVQTYILPVIPRVLLGVSSDDNGTIEESQIGKAVAWYSFLPFFDYNGTCNDGSIVSYFDGDTTDSSSSDVIISSVDDAAKHINDRDKSCNPDDFHYKYDHKFLVSTAVGVFLLYTFVTIAVQTAIRAIKFGICEFIAPIPIASYIDPKTSKSTFDKWVSTSIKVYLDLFIQLIVVYFIVFVFKAIVDDGNLSIITENAGSTWMAMLVVLFIIIGLFKFAKEFPKFISDMLGLGTNGAIGDILKGAGWKQLGGTLAAPAAMASSAFSTFRYSRRMDEGALRSSGRALSAMLRTGKSSLGAAINGKGAGDVYGTRRGVQATMERKINTKSNQILDRARYNEAYTPQSYRSDFEEIDDEIEGQNAIIEAQRERYERAIREHDETVMQDAISKINVAKEKIGQLKDRKRDIKQNLKRYRHDAIKNGDIAPPAGSIRSRISDAWNDFSGNAVPDSKSYHAAAGFMKDGKAIFNEAKNKITEKPTLITGNLSGLKYKKLDGSEVSIDAGFADVFSAFKNFNEGRAITDARFSGLDRSELEDLYGNAVKIAASKYVDAVETGTINNIDMKEKINRWQARLDNEINISKGDRNEITGQLGSDGNGNMLHGNLFKGANDLAEKFETKSSQLAATEAAKNGSNN